MSGALNLLLSGGPIRQALAARVHAVIWARRLMGGKSDVSEMRLLDDIDLAGRVALDVGAHSGNWSVNLARRVGPGGTVVAYEALPHYGRSLTMALRLLRVSNVRVRNAAAGAKEGTISLRWRSESDEVLTGRTHIDPDAAASAGVVQVPMVSLDQDLASLGIQPSQVGFVKIDVEGAEFEVLKGATNLLGKGHPVVFLETEPEWIERLGHSVQDVFDEMSRYGYRPHLMTGTGPVPTDIDAYLKQYANGRAYNNVLFLPSA